MRTTTAAFVFASLTALGACSSQQEKAAAPGGKEAAQSVPAGTEFTVRLNDAIGSKISTPGEFFTASVVTPIRASDGKSVVHEGALVRGRIVGVDQGQPGSIRLSFQTLDTDRGPVPISVTVHKPTSPQALFRDEEIYTPNLPYNAVLLPPETRPPASIGGGPAQPMAPAQPTAPETTAPAPPTAPPGQMQPPVTAPQPEAPQINLPVGTPLTLVLIQPLALPRANNNK